jgi:hypothetical protein
MLLWLFVLFSGLKKTVKGLAPIQFLCCFRSLLALVDLDFSFVSFCCIWCARAHGNCNIICSLLRNLGLLSIPPLLFVTLQCVYSLLAAKALMQSVLFLTVYACTLIHIIGNYSPFPLCLLFLVIWADKPGSFLFQLTHQSLCTLQKRGSGVWGSVCCSSKI